ncbi:MAG: hypothetical protein ACOYL3_01785 [Desulfuromonadaceae bacterium]
MAKGFQLFRDALSQLAGQYLEERMFIGFVEDSLLERLTNNKFTGRNTAHPVFVLKYKGESSVACPCTSKPKTNMSHIPKGVALTNAEPPVSMIKATYILHIFPFVMPRSGIDYNEFWSYINIRGIVPEDAIVGKEWKSWRSIYYKH